MGAPSPTAGRGKDRGWVPSTFGGRLVLTVVLLALATTTVSVVVVQVLMAIEQRPTSTEAISLAVRSSLIGGGLAILVGVLLGMLLARLVRRPIVDLIDRVTERGSATLEGQAASPEDSLDDPRLPSEFRELGTVFDDLLGRLATRQAELQQALAEAESAEESLGMVVRESREAKLMVRDGRVVVANPAACVTLGRTREDLLSGSAEEMLRGTSVFDEDDREVDGRDMLARVLEGPQVVRLERKGQQSRWYVVQAARHRAPHSHLLITARDVTEERRLGRIRSEILSLISHDLRSPLSVIVGYLDLMGRPLTDDERARAVESARRNADRMDALLEDLLTATRAEELLAPTSLALVPLVPLAEDVLSSFALANPGRTLSLDARCAPIVRGEERRLRQVLVNLVGNALKHASDSGDITVRLSCEGDLALMRVVDHGPGIAAPDRDVVFERFARLDGGQSRPGVGLGLYIVRIISENHGGGVRIEETPGGGATFTVQLPCTGHVVEGEVVLGSGMCAGSGAA